MGLRDWLSRLEQAAAGVCPACGHDGALRLLPIVWDGDGVQVVGPDARPDPCPACGTRPRRFGPIPFDGDRVTTEAE